MTLRKHSVAKALTIATALLMASVGTARADGDRKFSQTFVQRGPGLDAVHFGVGLAGRAWVARMCP